MLRLRNKCIQSFINQTSKINYHILFEVKQELYCFIDKYLQSQSLFDK